MASGCKWDLVAFGSNLDASAGLVSMLMAAGENKYSGNGAAGVATYIYPNEDGFIGGITGISEDGAIVEYRVRKISDPNYIRTTQFHRAQTEASDFNRQFMPNAYPIAKGDSIEANLTNAAAKMDAVLLWIGKGILPEIGIQPWGPVPKGAHWVKATTAHTATADTWTSGTMTFLNYNLKRDKSYRVLAAVADGATLLAARYAPLTGPDAENRPGIVGGDTDQINVPMYFKQPFQFEGLTGLNCETLCVAGDTSSLHTLLIQEI